jgi:glutamate-ammonia-ligase adenylyltransferase
MVRIAWRDLSGLAELGDTTRELSALAQVFIETALHHHYAWLTQQFGTPYDAQGQRLPLVVLAMGKLGAWELNFSSDIDLILCFPQAGYTTGAKRTVSHEEFFTRLGRALVQSLSANTADGFVFRVDLGLRPYGESGPMVMSFDGLETYYAHQGREWERYALIKARPLGDDGSFGPELVQMLKPFVYRRYLDYGVFESLRDMKHMIAIEVKRAGMQKNIKLGPGGIREIEFFGQIFQLLRGGVMPSLQQRPILIILTELARLGLISAPTASELAAAYVFLRNVEHRLQMYDDRQTHDLPDDNLARGRLAAAMGLADWRSFNQQLETHRQKVHRHFDGLLATEQVSGASPTSATWTEKLNDLWQSLDTDHQQLEALTAVGYSDTGHVVDMLKSMQNDSATRALSREGRLRLDRLIPLLLQAAGTADQPELVLDRIVSLIKAIGRRTSYLALLLENPAAIEHLVRLTEASPWIASYLARHPVLLDELLDTRTLYAPLHPHDLDQEIQQRLATATDDDPEHQLIVLRIFKQVCVLKVAAADVTGALPLMRVSDFLSFIAEALVKTVLELAWQQTTRTYGQPVCRLPHCKVGRGFAVIGYGKLGGLELGYGSDLDLVFLHAGTDQPTVGGPRSIDSNQFFSRLGQRLLHLLTVHTSAGILYETDMRLRPSGSAGMLVSHIGAFRDYQLNKAWTWEHQALIRARAIAGDPCIRQQFGRVRDEVLAQPRQADTLRQEVAQMRQRMRADGKRPKPGWFDLKQSPGGIVDIEFLVQYLVLLKAHEAPALLQWTDNVRLLQTLMESGVLDNPTADLLRHAYLILRAATHRQDLREAPAQVPQERFKVMRQSVLNIWQTYLGDQE